MLADLAEERRIPVEGGDLSVRVAGTGPPVLLLHGIPGSAATWDDVVRHLAERHTVLVPDLLGFGASSRPTESEQLLARGQADAAVHVVDELAPEGVVVVGHDFGGPVALEVVRERPELVRGLGLCATNVFPDTRIPLPIAGVTWPLVGRVLEHVLFSAPSLRLMLKQGSGDSDRPADRSTYLGDRAQQRAIRTIFATSLRELRERYAPLEDALRSVVVPALVAWGDSDPFFDVDHGRRTAAVAAARFVLYPGCGHFLPAERPIELASDITRLAAECGLVSRSRAGAA